MTVTLSMRARVALAPALRNVRGSHDDDGLIIARDLLRKIRVKREEAAAFEIETPQGTLVNVLKMETLPDTSVELDRREAVKLRNLVKSERWAPEDLDWIEVLLPQLEEAAKYQAKAAAAE